MTSPSSPMRADQAVLSRFPLGLLPTPLVVTRRLGDHLGLDLRIKRDDLIGFAQAGTKTRALEVLVADALAQGCDCVVGCGGLGSNFVPALAAAARVARLECHLVLVGDHPDGPDPNLAMARAWGATVSFTGDGDRNRIEVAAQMHAAALAAEGRRPYLLPRGGATPVGAAGAARAIAELDAALASRPPERIVVAVGSGATAAGLAVGIAARRWPTRLIAAVVSRPVDETGAVIGDLSARCADLLGWPRPGEGTLELVDAIGPGFHAAGPEGRAAADLALATEGLILDTTYTAKAMAMTVELARAGRGAGTTVFWHTGGMVAAVSGLMADECPAAGAPSSQGAP